MNKTCLIKILSLCAIVLASVSCFGQFSDNFSDGNFTTNPVWSGDVADFEVLNGELHLNAAAAGTSHLSTSSIAIDEASWEFDVKMDFNPSGSNFARVYLVASTGDLEGALDGYYVLIGGSPDHVTLSRQDGTSSTAVITGQDDLVDVDPVDIRVKVTRDNFGNWELMVDTTAARTGFISEGTANDNSHTTSSFFGVYTKYTSTRADKFFFDNIVVTGTGMTDTEKPTVNSVVTTSDITLDVTFSEAVTNASVQTLTNFSADNGLGNPGSVSLTGNVAELTFANAFTNGTQYQLTVKNIADNAGNILDEVSIPFQYVVGGSPLPGDVLITEIMADPSPQVGLPNTEYVELHNVSNKAFNLDGWKFEDKTLPTVSLLPEEYITIVDDAFLDDFVSSGKVLGIPTFPGLTNGGEELNLFDDTGTEIFKVVFDISWYGDSEKDDGGYSLEMINPELPCQNAANWTASNSSTGGTPGQQNSVFDTTPDLDAPRVTSFAVTDSTGLVVNFSESIDTASLLTTMYNINNGNSISSTVFNGTYDQLSIVFGQQLMENLSYELNIQGPADCSGNILVDTTLFFNYFKTTGAVLGEVLITEIMADPSPVVGLPNAEYLEIFNTTEKAFSLLDWKVNDRVLPEYLFFPGDYLILVDEDDAADFTALGKVVPMASFPSLTNTGGTLILTDDTDSEIFSFTYDDDMYGDPEKGDGGWSLEMINPETPCQNASNWIASNDPSGGTPGQQNSVFSTEPETTPPSVLRIVFEDAARFFIHFDEALEPSSLASASIVADNDVGENLSFQLTADVSVLQLDFDEVLQPDIVYTLTLNGFADCVGNVIAANSTEIIGIPRAIELSDLILNEILFNPSTGGADFIELYNKSNKILSTDPLIIQEAEYQGMEIIDEEELMGTSHLIFPGGYVVLTEDPASVLDMYDTPNPENFVEVDDFPNYPDDEGAIIVMDTAGNELDRVDYQDDWHFAILDDDDGVSLERIDFDLPTQDRNNWKSAAQSVGFATPGYLNSNFTEIGLNEEITITPEAFSPNSDGIDDFITIGYKLDQPGFVANAHIFDAKGREIIHLVKSEILGQTGIFTWDGTSEDQERAGVGIYILYLELFNENGDTKKFKEKFVLAADWN